MKKVKQILAIIGIILLVLLYLSTFICALTDSSETMRMFFGSLVATVIIPVLLWAYSFIYKLIKGSDSPSAKSGKDKDFKKN